MNDLLIQEAGKLVSSFLAARPGILLVLALLLFLSLAATLIDHVLRVSLGLPLKTVVRKKAKDFLAYINSAKSWKERDWYFRKRWNEERSLINHLKNKFVCVGCIFLYSGALLLFILPALATVAGLIFMGIFPDSVFFQRFYIANMLGTYVHAVFAQVIMVNADNMLKTD